MHAFRDRHGSVRATALGLVVRIGVLVKGLVVGVRRDRGGVVVVVVIEGLIKVTVIMLSVSRCRMAWLRLSIRLRSKPVNVSIHMTVMLAPAET